MIKQNNNSKELNRIIAGMKKGELVPKTPSRNYNKVTLDPQGITPFHNWDMEPTVEFHLDGTDYKLGNGDSVNKVTRVDNGKEELIGVNVKLQQYFDELGTGYYLVTRLDRVKSKNSGRSYFDYAVEFSAE